MKKILFMFGLVLLICSCDVNDDGMPQVHFENLAIDQVEVPSSFDFGETYVIKVWYKKPSTCHRFDGFYYDKDDNLRTIAVRSVVFENSNCEVLTDTTVEATFDFFVTNTTGTYIFKFWQGKDSNGQDVFYEVEVPIN